MNKQKLLITLKVVAIPTLYAIVLRLFFGIETWSDLYKVMSVTFLCLLPFITGVLTIYFSPKEKLQSFRYNFFVPWIPILIFLGITLAVAWEGWACWLMVLPVFLIMASIGGLIAAYFILKKSVNNLNISIVLLIPVLLAPIESQLNFEPATYQAYTNIDINSSAAKIWSNVTRVPLISEQEDKAWLTKIMGFPRPLKAELNFEGVGASRQAVFTKGLVFHEIVTGYTDQRLMEFSIQAIAPEIPSTTLDKHVVIGGQFFDVLKGRYELEKLSENNYRLHLSSNFQLSTSFNFYASIWARWIMKDIQQNILQVEKKRAEQA